MKRRIRLSWSPKHERPWCPGTTRPTLAPPSVATGWTSFLKVQSLVGLVRQRKTEPALDAPDELLDSLPPAIPAEQAGDSIVRG